MVISSVAPKIVHWRREIMLALSIVNREAVVCIYFLGSFAFMYLCADFAPFCIYWQTYHTGTFSDLGGHMIIILKSREHTLLWFDWINHSGGQCQDALCTWWRVAYTTIRAMSSQKVLEPSRRLFTCKRHWSRRQRLRSLGGRVAARARRRAPTRRALPAATLCR